MTRFKPDQFLFDDLSDSLTFPVEIISENILSSLAEMSIRSFEMAKMAAGLIIVLLTASFVFGRWMFCKQVKFLDNRGHWQLKVLARNYATHHPSSYASNI